MLVVVSPAKKLDFEPTNGEIPASFPEFQKEANMLAASARKLSRQGLRDLMGISEDLADLNWKRFKAMDKESTELNSKQAMFAFAGDTYAGLDAASLSDDDIAYAQDHMRILSGLYGALRPLDRVQPYRLEMGSRLQNRRAGNLYGFWGDTIAKVLDRDSGGVIVNCASNEYFKAAGKNLSSKVVTPAFKEEREDGPKMIGFLAKKARGMMARYVIQNRLTEIEALKAFNAEGYAFRPELSDDRTFTFTRPAP